LSRHDKIGSDEINEFLRIRAIHYAIGMQIRDKEIRTVNRIELKLNQSAGIGHLDVSANKGILKNWLAELTNLKYVSLSGCDLSDATLFRNSIYLEKIALWEATGTVASNIFECLKNVRDLQIMESEITFVADSLNGLQNLSELMIGYNDPFTIPEGLFKDLVGLKYLELSVNDIFSIPDCLFLNLVNLEELVICNYSLKALSSDSFKGLINLTSLNLSKNELTSLPEGLFKDLTSLREVNLSGNQISFLPKGIFEGLDKLEAINLSENLIEDIKNEEIPPHIRIEID
jgi:Leucine-rich repeat (LRR) protein